MDMQEGAILLTGIGRVIIRLKDLRRSMAAVRCALKDVDHTNALEPGRNVLSQGRTNTVVSACRTLTMSKRGLDNGEQHPGVKKIAAGGRRKSRGVQTRGVQTRQGTVPQPFNLTTGDEEVFCPQ